MKVEAKGPCRGVPHQTLSGHTLDVWGVWVELVQFKKTERARDLGYSELANPPNTDRHGVYQETLKDSEKRENRCRSGFLPSVLHCGDAGKGGRNIEGKGVQCTVLQEVGGRVGQERRPASSKAWGKDLRRKSAQGDHQRGL